MTTSAGRPYARHAPLRVVDEARGELAQLFGAAALRHEVELAQVPAGTSGAQRLLGVGDGRDGEPDELARGARVSGVADQRTGVSAAAP
jgi:hypothetical protein